MDREQEDMQFLGLFGIFKESYKIIISWRKIFTQITLTLILPSTFIFPAYLEISNALFQDIKHTEHETQFTRSDTKRYNNLSDTLSSERITFIHFKITYLIVFLILSLLSIAAVVYTIASVYTERELTFKKVMSVVPKVWKKIVVTLLCIFLAFFVYNIISVLIVFLVPYPFNVVLVYVCVIIYMVGSMYMTVCWQLASKDLIKGNQLVAIGVSFLLGLSFFIIKQLFELLVVQGNSLQVWKKVGFGALCSIMLLFIFFFGLVIHTVLYVVCKSYHPSVFSSILDVN